jgi:hypothetical protein
LGQPVLVLLKETGYELFDHEENQGVQKKAAKQAAKKVVKEGRSL